METPVCRRLGSVQRSLSDFPSLLLKLLLKRRKEKKKGFPTPFKTATQRMYTNHNRDSIVFLSFLEAKQGKETAGAPSFWVSIRDQRKHKLSCSADSIPPTTKRMSSGEEGEDGESNCETQTKSVCTVRGKKRCTCMLTYNIHIRIRGKGCRRRGGGKFRERTSDRWRKSSKDLSDWTESYSKAKNYKYNSVSPGKYENMGIKYGQNKSHIFNLGEDELLSTDCVNYMPLKQLKLQ